jgi:hypothetical protein
MDTKHCQFCGEQIPADARKCRACGEWLEAPPVAPPIYQAQPPVYQAQPMYQPYVAAPEKEEESPSNGFGRAGLTLSIIALCLGWVPFIGWILWLLGFIFSFIGIFKSPRGTAIAGMIISLVGVMTILIVTGLFVDSSLMDIL